MAKTDFKLPRISFKFVGLIILLLSLLVGIVLVRQKQYVNEKAAGSTVRFAVIGDYGNGSNDEAAVANMVKSLNPEFITTTGDNNYPDGAASTFDDHVGKYYSDYIYPYKGAYGSTATTNKFFPSPGNHDWHTPGLAGYLDYFTLPGNERYYDFVSGPVHFFMIDSDPAEPDSSKSTGAQATWLRTKMSASTAPFQFVFMHHAPFSSSTTHGSRPEIQWPFKDWGADAVLAGHDHTYERFSINGIPYFVNGAGGAGMYPIGAPIAGSQFTNDNQHGAMLVEATATQATFKFYNTAGAVMDSISISSSGGTLPTDSPTNPPGGTPGDVNKDGKVNIVDIGLIIDHYGESPLVYVNADLNNDGKVTIIDIGIVIDNYAI